MKTLHTLLLCVCALTLTGCVSLSAKVCVPPALASLVPAFAPEALKKAGCPVDFHYSNMDEPAAPPK